MIKCPKKQFDLCLTCRKNYKSIFSKQCMDCYNNSKKGIGNPNFKTGRYCFERICVLCNKNPICIDNQTGYCVTCARKLTRGSNHPNWKGGLPKCMDCGKLITFYATRCEKCAKQGKLHSNYIDGMGKFPYALEFNNKLKEFIRNRDHNKCQDCGISNKKHIKLKSEQLNVHHIDYNKNNCDFSNLISLCRTCHMKTNYNRDYWFAYYTYIIDNYIKE